MRPPTVIDIGEPALQFVVSFDYTTPKMKLDSTGGKALSWATRDWVFGGVLRYQSGSIIQSPFSSNNLLSNLARGPANNPALWGGGYTFMNRVPGQPLFIRETHSGESLRNRAQTDSLGCDALLTLHIGGSHDEP